MDTPQDAMDIAWWVISGLVVCLMSVVVAMLKYGGGKIIELLQSIVSMNNQQNKAIVELQTRCAMYHKNPVQEKINE